MLKTFAHFNHLNLIQNIHLYTSKPLKRELCTLRRRTGKDTKINFKTNNFYNDLPCSRSVHCSNLQSVKNNYELTNTLYSTVYRRCYSQVNRKM